MRRFLLYKVQWSCFDRTIADALKHPRIIEESTEKTIPA